jgi:hypothetical protein
MLILTLLSVKSMNELSQKADILTRRLENVDANT